MNAVATVAKRELRAYFNSPMAYVFLVVFTVGATLLFFNLPPFFAVGEASLRGLWDKVPLILLFLVPALTMRLWAEEARQGTLESLVTMPARDSQLVLGKFLASWALLGVGLLLTLGLPLTVASIGNLDWGPVIGGYCGAMLLGAAYLAIGQFVSATTENQLLAFILTLAVCLIFYGFGWAVFTSELPQGAAEFFRKLGTGSRFERIARGVLELHDVLYYATLTGFFLLLSVGALRARRM